MNDPELVIKRLQSWLDLAIENPDMFRVYYRTLSDGSPLRPGAVFAKLGFEDMLAMLRKAVAEAPDPLRCVVCGQVIIGQPWGILRGGAVVTGCKACHDMQELLRQQEIPTLRGKWLGDETKNPC